MQGGSDNEVCDERVNFYTFFPPFGKLNDKKFYKNIIFLFFCQVFIKIFSEFSYFKFLQIFPKFPFLKKKIKKFDEKISKNPLSEIFLIISTKECTINNS